MFFKCEAFNKEGKIVDSKNIEISVGGVSDATKNEKVQKLKKKAQQQGFGFRVQILE